MKTLPALCCSVAASLLACASPPRDHGPATERLAVRHEVNLATAAVARPKMSATPAKNPTRRSPVLQKVAAIQLPPAATGEVRYVPRRYAVGPDEAVAVELPGGFPGSIARISADGQLTTETGLLAADGALRFRGEGGRVIAESFDGKVAYQAVERVAAAAPWSDNSASSGCCGWWEHTLWRTDAKQLGAGLLRVVAPPGRGWSVIDLQLPGSSEPRWRERLTDGKSGAVAARMAPGAKQVALVLADKSGAAVLQARDASNGAVRWTAPLTTAPSEWRSGKGELAYSADGAQLAVLVESPKRCESCSAIELFDAANGKPLRRLELTEVVSPEHSRLGFSDGAVWMFEHVPAASSDLSARPARTHYEAFDLAKGTRRPTPTATWPLDKLWALAPQANGHGVLALGWRASGELLWLKADSTP